MTNKKAIRILRSIEYYLKSHTIESCEEEHTAISLAIKALELERVKDELNNELNELNNERPQGEWKEFIMPVPVSDNHYKIGVICSECNTTWDCSTNYCPYCGADMRGKHNE